MTFFSLDLLAYVIGLGILFLASFLIFKKFRSIESLGASLLFAGCTIGKFLEFSIYSFIPMQCPDGRCSPSEANQSILNFVTFLEPYIFLLATALLLLALRKSYSVIGVHDV